MLARSNTKENGYKITDNELKLYGQKHYIKAISNRKYYDIPLKFQAYSNCLYLAER